MLIKSSEQSGVNKISGGYVCDINNIGLQACKDDYQYFECTPNGFLVRSVAPGTICVDVGSSSSSIRSTAFSILTLILSLTLILGWGGYAHLPMIYVFRNRYHIEYIQKVAQYIRFSSIYKYGMVYLESSMLWNLMVHTYRSGFEKRDSNHFHWKPKKLFNANSKHDSMKHTATTQN